jgi:hypothetical protein
LTAGIGVLNISRIPGGVAFWIHVTPRARRPRVAGDPDDLSRCLETLAAADGSE